MNEFIVSFLSNYPSRSADCRVVSNLLRPRVPSPASRLIVVWFFLFLWAPMAPVLPAGGESLARAIIRSLVDGRMASAMALRKIVAQLIAPTPRRVVDTTSALVMAVFVGWSCRGGRHGFEVVGRLVKSDNRALGGKLRRSRVKN